MVWRKRRHGRGAKRRILEITSICHPGGATLTLDSGAHRHKDCFAFDRNDAKRPCHCEESTGLRLARPGDKLRDEAIPDQNPNNRSYLSASYHWSSSSVGIKGSVDWDSIRMRHCPSRSRSSLRRSLWSGGSGLLLAPCRRAPDERVYRIRPRHPQRATIAGDCVLEPHFDRKSGACRLKAMPDGRRTLPAYRVIANTPSLEPTGPAWSLGSRSASLGYGAFNRGSFSGLAAACTEIFSARYWRPGWHAAGSRST